MVLASCGGVAGSATEHRQCHRAQTVPQSTVTPTGVLRCEYQTAYANNIIYII